MRTNERTLDDGSEGLFVEEFQSDRHQAGRKQGYDDKTENGLDVATREFNSIVKPSSPATPSEVQQLVLGNLPGDTEWARKALGDNFERIRDLARQDMRGIQDAPFRTTWPIQLFKRALRDAVDGGKDWIGWTNGETQNERFDLSKQVDSISVPMVNADGSRSVRIDPKDGTSFKMMVDSNGIVNGYQSADQFTGKRLDEVVGKDMADKIIALESPANFEGNDLKVGGSGMRGFYDNMLPKEVGKYVKQFGGKVEKADMTQSVEADIMSGEEAETGSIPIWKVNITPEMRKISQTGQMRFMPEGDVEPVKKPTEISKGTKDALPVIQAVDDKGELKFKDGKPVPQIIPYNFLKSPKLVEYDKNNPTDKTKTNYAELAYDIPKSAQKKIDQAIDSGAVDAVVGDVVKRTKKYLENPEIAAGMGWYSRMRVKLVKALGEQGRETLSQLLGATSARTPVRENFLQAMDAYEGINAGRYEPNRKAYIDMLQLEESGTLADEIVNRGYLDILSSKINDIEEKAKSLKGQDQSNLLKEAKNLKSLINQKPESWKPSQRAKIMILATDMLPKRSNGKKFNANSLAVLKVIHGSWLDNRNAPKTPNFAGNLSGRTLQATIDVWAARFLRAVLYEGKKTPWRIQPKAESAVTNEDFAIGQIIFERAAKKLKMNPDDLQAVLWFAEKDRWDKMGWTQKVGAEKSSFDDIFSIFFPDKQKPLSFEEASAKLASEGYAESAQNLDQETEDNE
jgi:hypothetical protein